MPINPEGGFETELERDIRMSRKRYANRVYTNANKMLVDQRFRVFHCKRCTSYVLITDADIQGAPRRRTDNAIVFCPEKNFVKLRTKPVLEPLKVRRLKGIETQYIHACADCGLHIAYQSVPHNKITKSTSPIDASAEAVSSTPTTTASPASVASVSPSPAAATSSQTASGAAATSGAPSPYVACAPERHSGITNLQAAAEDSSFSTARPADNAAVSCGKVDTAAAPLGHTLDDSNVNVAVFHASTAGTSTTVTDTLVTSPVATSPRPSTTNKDILKSPAGHACAVSKQADKSASNSRSVPLIYLIETAVIFPTKVKQIRLRCRICGFIPRNEIQFEEHKRDRGHWDQESGHFSLQEDNGDAPINPIIVG